MASVLGLTLEDRVGRDDSQAVRQTVKQSLSEYLGIRSLTLRIAINATHSFPDPFKDRLDDLHLIHDPSSFARYLTEARTPRPPPGVSGEVRLVFTILFPLGDQAGSWSLFRRPVRSGLAVLWKTCDGFIRWGKSLR
jgi:hypothetical protein